MGKIMAGIMGAVSHSITSTFSNVYSMLLDGSAEYFTIPHNASLDFSHTDAFSVSSWFKLTNNGKNQVLVGKREESAAGPGWTYWIPSSDKASLILVNTSVGAKRIYVVGTTSLSTGVWYNLITTYDGSTNASGVTIYLNGSDDTDGTPITDDLAGSMENNDEVFIGAHQPNGSPNLLLDGNIDEVSVWNKELSSTEVTELYNSGVPADLSSHSASGNLVSWWRMGDDSTWDGSNHTVPDQIASNDATSVAMEEADKEADVPS